VLEVKGRLGVRLQCIDGTELWPEVSQGTSKDKKVHDCVSDQWLIYIYIYILYIAPGEGNYNGLP